MKNTLLRNSLSNFGAGAIPAVAMLATLPIIVRLLGTELYGVLAMVMAITGYFSIIDINVTAASTKYLAEYHAKGDTEKAHQVVMLGGMFYGALGLIGTLALWAFNPWLVSWLMKSSPQHHAVAREALQWAAVGFFFAQAQNYLNSIPQALERFDLTAKLEALFGVAVPVGSVIVLHGGYGLVGVVMLRVACSIAHTLLLCVQCRLLLPGLSWVMPTRGLVKQMADFSAFSYLSRLAAMTHSQVDKLIVGSLMGMTALAYYTIGGQIIGRVTALTFRLSSVLFPASSAMQARGETARLRELYLMGSRYAALLNGGVILVICLIGKELLFYWMGPAFAENAYFVLLFFSFAMFVDSLTTLPSLINDGLGHPRLTGVFSIIRALSTVTLTYILASHFALDWVALGTAMSALVLAISFLAIVHGRTIPVGFWELFQKAIGGPLLLLALFAVAGFTLRPEGVMSIGHAAALAITFALAGIAVALPTVVLGQHRARLWVAFAARR